MNENEINLEKEEPKTDYHKILKDIFVYKEKDDTVIPIIQSSTEITHISSFFFDSSIKIEYKISFIKELSSLFISNPIIIPFIEKCMALNNDSLYYIAFSLYLNKENTEEEQEVIKSFLKLLVKSIQVTKEIVEFIYQKMSTLYYIESDKALFIKLIELLILVFTVENEEEKQIQQYIYFNGKGSEMTTTLNDNRRNIYVNMPNTINGISTVFWIYLDRQIITEYFELNKNKTDFAITLVEYQVENNGFLKVLMTSPDSFELKCRFSEQEYFPLQCPINHQFKYGEWNFIAFVLEKKKKTKTKFTIYINGHNRFGKVELKEMLIEKEVKSITLFKNVIGKINTPMIFFYEIEQELIQILSSAKPCIFSNKYLLNLFKAFNSNYLSLPSFFGEKIKGKIKNLYSESVSKNGFLLGEKITNKDMIDVKAYEQKEPKEFIIFGPFTYDKRKNTLDDVCGNFIAQLSPNDGVSNYKSNAKKILLLGGIQNFLPIVELMKSEQNYLCKEIFSLFIILLKNTLVDKPHNLSDANHKDFSRTLSLFIEHFPSELFDQQIFDYFVEIAKFIFSQDSLNTKTQKNNFIQCLFLNDKIIIKFPISIQIQLWAKVQNFYESDDEMINYLDVSKICSFLRYYDNQMYNEYCCQEHADLFNVENKEVKIMSPPLKIKISSLLSLIQYVLKKEKDESNIELLKMLSLDLSPCLQKAIIMLYINHFSDQTIPAQDKIFTLTQLLSQKNLEVCLYVLSSSLLDVRCKLIILIKILLQDYSEELIIYFKKNNLNKRRVIGFIKDNLLLYNTQIPLTHIEQPNMIVNSDSNKLTVSLDKLLNQKHYKEQIPQMWEILQNWIEIKMIKNKENKIEYRLVEFVIEFMIEVSTKSGVKSYSNFLLLYLDSAFTDNTCVNIHDICKNGTLFKWILEVNYLFGGALPNPFDNNNQNEVLKMKSCALSIFKKIIKENSEGDDLKKIIQQVMQYSMFLKKECTEDTRKDIIIDITGRLLQNILSSTNPNKIDQASNFVTLAVFQFLFFFDYFDSKDDIELIDKGYVPKFMYNIVLGKNPNEVQNMELRKIWKNYPLFEVIMGQYSYIWSLDTILKNVNLIEFDYSHLIDEYCFTWKKKDILLKDLLKLIDPNHPEETNRLMILKIINMLFYLMIQCATLQEEKEFWCNDFKMFIVFLVLASINITPSTKKYSEIQDGLALVITYGFTLLKKNAPRIYEELVAQLIEPIFEKYASKQQQFIPISYKNNISQSAFRIVFGTIDRDGNITKNSTIYNVANLSTDRIINFKGIEESSKLSSTEIVSFSFMYVFLNKNEALNVYDAAYSEIKGNFEKVVKVFIQDFGVKNKRKRIQNYISFKRRKNKYKELKRKMFSWKGLWSDKVLFFEHPEKLKLKVKNHLTQEMIKPILVPILDINYYLPEYSKFQKDKLFNVKNEYKYKINMDIDTLFGEEEEKEPENECNKVKLLYLSLWNEYDKNKLRNNQNCFHYKNLLNEMTMEEMLTEKKKYSIELQLKAEKEKEKEMTKEQKDKIKQSNRNEDEFIHCCLVKQAIHIRGIISIEEKKLKFYYLPDDHIQPNDINYDKDKGICFGSFFPLSKRDKSKVGIQIKYADIKYLFSRTYFYQKNAIEIFTEDHKDYYFAFSEEQSFYRFINLVLNHLESTKVITIEADNDQIRIGFEKVKGEKKKNNTSKQITNSTKVIGKALISFSNNTKELEWLNYKISSLEYLMWINILGNRSFIDLTQYPVFPWIFIDYDKGRTDIVRNMRIPMGMLKIGPKGENRALLYQETYQSMIAEQEEEEIEEDNPDDDPLSINQKPYYYGSHYSNPTYVSHYLMRMFPFANIMIEIQGERFDDPERLFISLQKTFESCTTQKCDVRELLPEFFYLPDLFINSNNLNLEQTEEEENINDEKARKKLNDVAIPDWCNNSPFNFVIAMREQLEDPSLNLNNWIDLIFGVNQRGKGAVQSENLFMPNTYLGAVNISKVTDQESREALMRLVEMGMTPEQVLFTEAKSKTMNGTPQGFCFMNATGSKLCENKEIIMQELTIHNYNDFNKIKYASSMSAKSSILMIKAIDESHLFILSSRNTYKILKMGQILSDIKNEEEGYPNKIKSDSFLYKPNYLMSSVDPNKNIIIYHQNHYILRSGFWDGRIELSLFTQFQNKEILNAEYESISISEKYSFPVVVMKMNKEENMLVTGRKNGIVNVYKVNKVDLRLLASFFHHSDEVTSIALNSTLFMFATSSYDGYINIYILPLCTLVRSIRLKKGTYAKEVFLSNAPLPSIIVFTNEKKFITFSLSGRAIFEMEETCSEVISPVMMRNNNFLDYLIYGTEKGMIKIRKFPKMELICELDTGKGKPIRTIEISSDMLFCFAWVEGEKLIVFKNKDVVTNVEDPLNRVGFTV